MESLFVRFFRMTGLVNSSLLTDLGSLEFITHTVLTMLRSSGSAPHSSDGCPTACQTWELQQDAFTKNDTQSSTTV